MTASISTLTSSSAAYHCRGREMSYSLLDDRPTSFWLGQGAANLGLTGSVDEAEFRHLLRGFSPEGERPLVQNAGDEDRQCGTEITLSVPGTLAALFASSGNESKARLARIILESAKVTIAIVESELSYSRRGSQGEINEAVKGLIVACFLDLDNRNHQSMPHVHCCVINAALRQDGTFGSLESKPFYVAQKHIGQVFHEILAHRMEQELGLALMRGNSIFEVQGVPASVFPVLVGSRRQEVLAALAPEEATNAKAAEHAVRSTRQRKTRVPHKELFRKWEELGQTVGFTKAEAERLFHQQLPGNEQSTPVEPVGTKPEAAQRISAKPQEKLTGKQGSRTDEQSDEGNAKQKKRATADGHSSERKSRHEVPQSIADRVLSKRKWQKLSSEQRQAVHTLTVFGDSVAILEAPTGTGKDTVIAAASEIWKKAGYSVLGTAPDSRSSQSLASNTRLKAKPLGRVLSDFEATRLKRVLDHIRQIGRAVIAKPTWRLQRTKLGPKSVLVVDEASLISQTRLNKVVAECQLRQSKLVLVSDPILRSTVGRKADFQDMVKEGSRKATLSSIQRQKNPAEREALEGIRPNGLGAALKKLAEAGRLKTSADPMLDALQAWKVHGIKNPKEHVLVAKSREKAVELNRLAQALRKSSGRCGFRFLWVDPTNPWERSKELSAKLGRALNDKLGMTRFRPATHQRIHEGDRIVCTADYSLKGIRIGMTGTVRRIKLGRHPEITVKFDDGKSVTIYRETYKGFQLAYAFAAEDLRGRTVGNAYVLLTDQEPVVTYLQITRGSESNHIFARPEALEQESPGQRVHRTQEHWTGRSQHR